VTKLGAKTARTLVAAGLAAVLLWIPRISTACAVCMSGNEEQSRQAFIWMTAFMTFLPLVMLFFAIRWFVRRAIAREQEDDAARQATITRT